METITIDLLTSKLKDAPQSVLERVNGYVDALVEPATNFKFNCLSANQQQILDSQIDSDKSIYIDADKLYENLKIKYEL